MDSIIRWIQLSDLHFGDDSQYSKNSRNAFIKYITDINSISDGLDCIFVTGDIIFAKYANDNAKRSVAYSQALEYLKQIYNKVWPDNEDKDIGKRIFMVPGNHDVIRDAARQTNIKGIALYYDEHGMIDKSFCDQIYNSMKEYYKFEEELKGSSCDRSLFHHVISNDKVNILHINTCIASGKDNEEGELILCDEWVAKALEKADKKLPTIAVGHHGIELLKPSEQKNIEITLKNHGIFLYLCGHTHERESNFILRYNQKNILNSFTSGTLMVDLKSRSTDTVFLVGKMDLNSHEGKILSYKWNQENGWHEDKEFGLVQGMDDNVRTFRAGEIDVPFYSRVKENSRTPKRKNNRDGVYSKILTHISPERSNAFADINSKANDSLSVYGIGITHVSKDKELLKRILKNGGRVRLCMVDPDVFKNDICNLLIEHNKELREANVRIDNCCLENLNFCIYPIHMDEYIREEYVDDILKSYERIRKIQKEIKDKDWDFQVRKLRSFVPISINIVNEEKENAELIAEYNMPFVKKRMLMSLSKRQNSNYYAEIAKVYEEIWNKSIEVKDED